MAAPARQYNNPSATYDNYVDDLPRSIRGAEAEYASSRFSAPVNTIFNYQTADIRAEVNEVSTVASIATESRGLKELVARHSNEVFSFIGTDLSGSVAEAIFRRFGLDTRPINHQYRVGSVSASLELDSGVAAIMAEIESGYAAADVSGQANLSGFTTGLKWLIAEYKRTGEAVSHQEMLINQKLIELDLVTKKVGMFTTLPQNGASTALVGAFEAYIDAAFKEAGIPALYDELVRNYKKWCILRELVAAPIGFAHSDSESMCSICLNESITHCVSPCGHTFCSSCIRKMNTACYLCRGAIRDRVRLFFN